MHKDGLLYSHHPKIVFLGALLLVYLCRAAGADLPPTRVYLKSKIMPLKYYRNNSCYLYADPLKQEVAKRLHRSLACVNV